MKNDKPLEIKKTPVILTIIFDFLTCGIYSCAWFLVRIDDFNKLAGYRSSFGPKRLKHEVFIFCLVFWVLAFICGFISGFTEQPAWLSVGFVLSLIGGVVLLVQCFKAKVILEHYLVYKTTNHPKALSGIATFFFRIYYLQYVINKTHKKTSAPAKNNPQVQPDIESPSCNAVKNYDQLLKLKTLHNEGILTEEEYLAEKNKLM